MALMSFSVMPASKSTRNALMVRIWPDGEWALLEDIREGEYDWKSDDFMDVDLNNSIDRRRIDALDPLLLNEIENEVFAVHTY